MSVCVFVCVNDVNKWSIPFCHNISPLTVAAVSRSSPTSEEQS